MTAPDEPLTCLDDVHTLWSSVLGCVPAHGRSLWLAFVDHDGHPNPALTQIDGVPLRPDASAVNDLVAVVSGVMSDDPQVRGVLICLERGGTSGASPFEESWADALTTGLGDALAWPVLARTPKGVSRVRLWTSAA